MPERTPSSPLGTPEAGPLFIKAGGRQFAVGSEVAVERSGGAFEQDAGWKLTKIDLDKNEVTVVRPHPDRPGKFQAIQDSISAFQKWQERAFELMRSATKPAEHPAAAPLSRRELRQQQNPGRVRDDLMEGWRGKPSTKP